MEYYNLVDSGPYHVTYTVVEDILLTTEGSLTKDDWKEATKGYRCFYNATINNSSASGWKYSRTHVDIKKVEEYFSGIEKELKNSKVKSTEIDKDILALIKEVDLIVPHYNRYLTRQGNKVRYRKTTSPVQKKPRVSDYTSLLYRMQSCFVRKYGFRTEDEGRYSDLSVYKLRALITIPDMKKHNLWKHIKGSFQEEVWHKNDPKKGKELLHDDRY
tara:strand:+ start:4540 stop:5187 length:648 start_codon:yes stop_codon:yes gene_type:complete